MKEWILRVADFLPGESPSPTGEGLDVALEHTWPWAPWVTLAFMSAAALVVVLAYRYESIERRGLRWLLVGLRLVALGMVLLMMYGWMRNAHRTDLADIVIVLDASTSMEIVDAWGDSSWERGMRNRLSATELSDATRLNLAKSVLIEHDARLVRELEQRYHVRFFAVGAGTQAFGDEGLAGVAAVRDLQADQPVSRLGAGLLEVLELQRGRPTAAVVMFTDGVTTDGKTLGDVSEIARRRQLPLYFVAMGNDAAARDVKLTDLVVDEVAFVNDLLNFDTRVTATGYAGKLLTLRLLREGSEEVLAESSMPIPISGETATVRLSHRPKDQGEFRYRVEAVPQEGELNVSNNRQERTVRVSEETIRILFVQGYPSYEFRTLKTLLSRQLKTGGEKERAVLLTTILQESDPEYASADETAERVFPANRDTLFEYDVLIFGDCDPSLFAPSTLANIAEFIKVRGAGVVFLGGPRFTPAAYRDSPLAELFPVRLEAMMAPSSAFDLVEPFVAAPSLLGQSSPLVQLADTTPGNLPVWSSLPGMYWLLEAPELKPGAIALLEHPTKTSTKGERLPVMCMQYVGAGNVIMLLSDETWRWSRDERGSQFYDRFWEQVIRYLGRARLLGSDRIELTTNRQDDYPQGEPVHLRVRFLDERKAPAEDRGVTILVQHEGGNRKSIGLARDASTRGTFTGTLSNLAEGTYRAWVVSPAVSDQPPSTSFRIVPPRGEQSRLETDLADLTLAAKRSSGRVFTMQDVETLLPSLPRGLQVRVEALPPRPLWNSWPLPLAFLIVLTVEWIVRKRLGLL